MKRLFQPFLLCIFFITIPLISCTVQTKTSTIKKLDIYGPGVIQRPVVVDLDVMKNKIIGEATGSGSNIEAVKRNAIENALEIAGADVLVEPKFKTSNDGSKVTASVTGWPAFYVNFQTITFEDIELLKAGLIQTAEVYDSGTTDVKNNAGIGFLVVLMIAIGIVAGTGGI